MHKRITCRGMDHSDALENYVNDQLAKVISFLENEREPIYLDVVLESGTPHAHPQVEVRLKSPNYDLISNYEGNDMYDTIDRVIDVMYQQLQEKKEERVDKKKKGQTFYKKHKGDSFKGA